MKGIWTLMEYLMLCHYPVMLSDGWEGVHGIVFTTVKYSKQENHITSLGEGNLRFSGGSVFKTEISRMGEASRQKLKVRGWEWGIRWVSLSHRGNYTDTALGMKGHFLERNLRGLHHSVAREEAWKWNWGLLSVYFLRSGWEPLHKEVPDWIQGLGNLLLGLLVPRESQL